jgi:membrane protein required for colicin V production
MNWFDIVIAFFLIIAFLDGYRKGLIMQLVILAGVLIAVIFSGKLAAVIQPTLERITEFTPETLHAASYILSFIAIAIVAVIVGSIIEKIIDIVFLGFFNRILGAITAMATTLIIFSLAINLLLILDTDNQIFSKRTKDESFFFNRVEMVVPAIVPYLNRELWERYLPEIEREERDLELTI